MGVTNAFGKANELLEAQLRFRVQGEASEFRQRLHTIGWARFEHCVTLTKLWAKPTATGGQKYARLIDLMRMVTPQKPDAVKYRDPASEHGRDMNRQMDLEFAARIAREP